MIKELNIQKILEEFRKEFVDSKSTNNIHEYVSAKRLEAFLTQKLREAIKEIVPANCQGYGRDEYVNELNQNITNFFNE